MSFDKLPDHFMLSVFKKLCTKDLLRVRLVCRNWAAIVSDSIALRRKYSLYISDRCNKYNLDTCIQTFTNSPYNICTNVSFSDVFFDEESETFEEMLSKTECGEGEYVKIKESIEIMNTLWNKIGVHIECLRIVLWSDLYYKSTQHNWLALLENTPNLISLEIKSGRYNTKFSGSTNVARDFNLAKLKTVTICCRDSRLNLYLMKILIKFASELTSIEFKKRTSLDFDTLYFLIESQRHSLKELKLGDWIGKEYFSKCFTIKNLSLEVLHLDSVLDKGLLKLLGNHKNLRDLKIKYIKSIKNLRQYPTYLPKLEKLEFHISFDCNNPITLFHKDFNNLKSLKISTDGIENKIIKFESPSICQTLEILEIKSVKLMKISPFSLPLFIQSYPNLKVLKLINISCGSQNVIAICNKLVHLEELELRIHSTHVVVDRMAFSNISNLRKLKRLSVKDYIQINDDRFFIKHLRLPSLISLSLSRPYFRSNTENETNRGIFGLIDNCPLLEFLYLENFDGITDANVEEILERLVHLRKLSISGKKLSRKRKFQNN